MFARKMKNMMKMPSLMIMVVVAVLRKRRRMTRTGKKKLTGRQKSETMLAMMMMLVRADPHVGYTKGCKKRKNTKKKRSLVR